jgi:coproporphyrinogen III oxidase
MAGQNEGAGMIELDYEQQEARAWFETLRDRIAANSKRSKPKPAATRAFIYTPWDRRDEPDRPAVRRRSTRPYERCHLRKGGVNVSTVGGRFSPEFARTMHGAADDPRFLATGISLVAHMANPHVPAVHMNTRLHLHPQALVRRRRRSEPSPPYEADTSEFHSAFQAACDRADPTYYERFRKWADDYFYLPHRGVSSRRGRIFYDHLEGIFRQAFRVHPRCGRELPGGLSKTRKAADGESIHR